MITKRTVIRIWSAMGFCWFVWSHGVLADTSSGTYSRMDQIKVIEQDFHREKEKYTTFETKEKSLLEQLSDLERRIADQRNVLEQLRKKIRLDREELISRQQSQRNLEMQLRSIEGRLAKRLVAFYKYAKRGCLRLLGTSRGFDQLRKRVKYLKVITEDDQRLFLQVLHLQNNLKEDISLIQEKLTAIAQLEKGERQRYLSFKQDMDKKVVLLMKIHKEKEFHKTAVKELELAARNLKLTIQNLEKGQSREKADRMETLPSDFQNYKGKLPLPFEGKVIKGGGPLGTGEAKMHKGFYIEGPPGAEVKSVFAGRVDYSGWLRGYGQIIVINHGNRYFSVFAHLLRRAKEEGDMVEKGEVIGLLGDTESLSGPRLYFEIRKGSQNLDVSEWLKVH